MKAKEELNKEFYAAISSYTLRFHDPEYESAYIVRRLSFSIRSRYIKLTFMFFIFLIGWSCYEIFSVTNKSKKYSATAIIVIMVLFALALISELLFVFRFPVMRGVLTLVMSFIYIFYRSYTGYCVIPVITHLYSISLSPPISGLVLLFCNFSLAIHYVYSWMTAAVACLVGAGTEIFFLEINNITIGIGCARANKCRRVRLLRLSGHSLPVPHRAEQL